MSTSSANKQGNVLANGLDVLFTTKIIIEKILGKKQTLCTKIHQFWIKAYSFQINRL